MISKSELEGLAQLRLDDAVFLLGAARYSSAYYLAGYAVELALKACIAKLFQPLTIPDKGFVEKIYRHDLEQLFNVAGLKTAFDQDCDANLQLEAAWNVAQDWNEASRYALRDAFEATELVAAINDPNDGGVSMGEETLVEQKIADALTLVKKLDELGESPNFVAWYYSDDAEHWRLLISSEPLMDFGQRIGHWPFNACWKSFTLYLCAPFPHRISRSFEATQSCLPYSGQPFRPSRQDLLAPATSIRRSKASSSEASSSCVRALGSRTTCRRSHRRASRKHRRALDRFSQTKESSASRRSWRPICRWRRMPNRLIAWNRFIWKRRS